MDDHMSLKHVNAPHFFLRAEFEDQGNTTKITWTMTFDTREIFEAVKSVIMPANEQNLDRLEACLTQL